MAVAGTGTQSPTSWFWRYVILYVLLWAAGAAGLAELDLGVRLDRTYPMAADFMSVAIDYLPWAAVFAVPTALLLVVVHDLSSRYSGLALKLTASAVLLARAVPVLFVSDYAAYWSTFVVLQLVLRSWSCAVDRGRRTPSWPAPAWPGGRTTWFCTSSWGDRGG